MRTYRDEIHFERDNGIIHGASVTAGTLNGNAIEEESAMPMQILLCPCWAIPL